MKICKFLISIRVLHKCRQCTIQSLFSKGHKTFFVLRLSSILQIKWRLHMRTHCSLFSNAFNAAGMSWRSWMVLDVNYPPLVFFLFSFREKPRTHTHDEHSPFIFHFTQRGAVARVFTGLLWEERHVAVEALRIRLTMLGWWFLTELKASSHHLQWEIVLHVNDW